MKAVIWFSEFQYSGVGIGPIGTHFRQFQVLSKESGGTELYLNMLKVPDNATVIVSRENENKTIWP